MIVKMYSFIPFIIVVISFGIFSFRRMPETKNKSYVQIYKDMGLSDLAKQAHEEEGEEEDVDIPTITFVS